MDERIKTAALIMAIEYVETHSPRYIFPLQEKGKDAGLKIAIFTREQVLSALQNGKWERACNIEAGTVKITKFQRDKLQQAFGKPVAVLSTQFANYDELPLADNHQRARTFEKIAAETMKKGYHAIVQWIGGLNNVRADIVVNGVRYEVKGHRGTLAQQ